MHGTLLFVTEVTTLVCSCSLSFVQSVVPQLYHTESGVHGIFTVYVQLLNYFSDVRISGERTSRRWHWVL